MNFKELAENAGLAEEEFVDIVRVFVDATTSDLDRLKAAVEGGAVGEVIEAAHSIKGSAINFGFDRLRDRAKEIEMNARRGILDGAVDGARLLEEELRLIVEKLDARASDG